MIITDKFVYIHVPKTGGTFVTTMLKKLHGFKNTGQKSSGFLERIVGKGRHGLLDIDKHGTCSQIPKRHGQKLIVSSIRSPYDRYVSQYEFKWWLKEPDCFGHPDEVRKLFPSFPDLSFEEYVSLTNTFLVVPGNDPKNKSGWHTTQFIKFFAKEPNSVIEKINKEYIGSEAWRQDFFPVHFLRTSNLNKDLHDFLLGMGYSPTDLAPILTSGKIFPSEGGRDASQGWERYFTPELKRFVRTREWMLFELFPEFDV